MFGAHRHARSNRAQIRLFSALGSAIDTELR